MIFRYSYAASAGNSGIVIFEIKNAHKTIKMMILGLKIAIFTIKNENP